MGQGREGEEEDGVGKGLGVVLYPDLQRRNGQLQSGLEIGWLRLRVKKKQLRSSKNLAFWQRG